MRYTDGTVARVGDCVRIWNVDTGVIVASMDTGEYSAEYPEAEWGYLKTGVMVRTDTVPALIAPHAAETTGSSSNETTDTDCPRVACAISTRCR